MAKHNRNFKGIVYSFGTQCYGKNGDEICRKYFCRDLGALKFQSDNYVSNWIFFSLASGH